MAKLFVALIGMLAAIGLIFSCVARAQKVVPAPVVMMTEVFVCGKYRGAFLVTADGHWLFESAYSWPLSEATIALKKLPEYAQAELDPADKSEGDCPPKVSIHLEEP